MGKQRLTEERREAETYVAKHGSLDNPIKTPQREPEQSYDVAYIATPEETALLNARLAERSVSHADQRQLPAQLCIAG